MISETMEVEMKKQQDLLEQANEQLDLKEEEIKDKLVIYDSIENCIIGIESV